ncbi:MAG: hypothetical protein M3415_03770 [Actinomycetota bacterium]|nr:hypothetical protein [Actinomycetota bacterium]
MAHGAMLLLSGLVMVAWRPCRSREGRAPRVAIALLLLSAATIWLGSFSLAVALAAGVAAGGLEACGVVWRQLLAGDLVWWRSMPLLVWAVVFPLRGLRAMSVQLHQSRVLATKLVAAGEPMEVPGASNTCVVVVSNLSTPAITLRLAHPIILLDRIFWQTAAPMQRDIVLVHELAHARGRHGVVEALSTLLTDALRPLPAGRDLYDCVRRHLEALADDSAARRHGRVAVGTTLGRVALAGYPATGLGAAGSCVWRVGRLVAQDSGSSWRDRGLLLALVISMAAMLVVVGADTATALGPVVNPDFCPL